MYLLHYTSAVTTARINAWIESMQLLVRSVSLAKS